MTKTGANITVFVGCLRGLVRLVIGDLETMDFVLTDQFAKSFNLSRREIEEVNKTVAETLHQYRTLEAKHLKQTDAPPQIGSARELANSGEAVRFD